jgi:ABC-type polysaccharide/polyol phosphate transport system ATPase subunit
LLPDATRREFVRIRGILLASSPIKSTRWQTRYRFLRIGAQHHMPVRTYSTGMLGFALVTGVTSEILLFDELIGAGDERFVNKAQQRLQSFIEQSSILIVATHGRSVLDQWCNRAFLLEQHVELSRRSSQWTQRSAAAQARRTLPSTYRTSASATLRSRSWCSRFVTRSDLEGERGG